MANTKEAEILEVGQELIQTVGYEGFSYRDIAERVGIKSATIHYYFPAKSDLALAVVTRFRGDFSSSVAAINDDDALTSRQRLERFAGLFQETLDSGRVCLGAMLASDSLSTPTETNVEVLNFFEDQRSWVAAVLANADDSVAITGDIDQWAAMFVAALEGAMLIARSLDDPSHLDSVVEGLLSLTTPTISGSDRWADSRDLSQSMGDDSHGRQCIEDL